MNRLLPALLAAALVVVACGDEEDGGGLEWAGEPVTTEAPTGHGDQVVVGEIRNSSDNYVTLVAERVRVVDRADDPVASDARFVSTFVHGLYGADVPARDLPDSERIRLGLTAVLEPGGTTPVYAAFRSDSADRPLALSVANESLAIPPTPGD